MTTLQTLKSKIDKLTNMIDFVELPSFSLGSPSVVTSIQYVCYLYEENKSVSNVNNLRYRMFIKKNLSEDRLPSTSDASVLHLRRAFTFLLNSFCSFIKNIKYDI